MPPNSGEFGCCSLANLIQQPADRQFELRIDVIRAVGQGRAKVLHSVLPDLRQAARLIDETADVGKLQLVARDGQAGLLCAPWRGGTVRSVDAMNAVKRGAVNLHG